MLGSYLLGSYSLGSQALGKQTISCQSFGRSSLSGKRLRDSQSLDSGLFSGAQFGRFQFSGLHFSGLHFSGLRGRYLGGLFFGRFLLGCGALFAALGQPLGGKAGLQRGGGGRAFELIQLIQLIRLVQGLISFGRCGQIQRRRLRRVAFTHILDIGDVMHIPAPAAGPLPCALSRRRRGFNHKGGRGGGAGLDRAIGIQRRLRDRQIHRLVAFAQLFGEFLKNRIGVKTIGRRHARIVPGLPR